MHYVLENKIPVAVDNLSEWAMGFDDTQRRVESTHIGDVFISTVFLGLDHNFGGGGDPVLFETMVFGDGDDDEICIRYSTYDNAVKGHWAQVKKYNKTEPVKLPEDLFLI